jgi:YVTN family beta-propeller protein
MSLDARARRAAQAARTNVGRLPPPPAIGVLVVRRRRRAAAANALALALIVAVVGVAWRALPTGGQTATGLPGHVQAAIRVGRAPGAVLVAGGSVWVANSGDGTVSRIDPATNRVVQTLPLPVNVGDVLAADGWLWVSVNDGTVWRLDPADGRVSASISVASRGVSVLASGGGRLWAAGTGDTLVAINPQRPTVTLRFLEEGPPPCCGDQPWHTGLAVVGGVMWESVSGGMVYRFPVAPRGLSHVAVGADAVWTTADNRSILYRIDPRKRLTIDGAVRSCRSPCYPPTSARAWVAWPSALTLYQARATLPSWSIRKVERITPTVVLP